MKLIIIFLLTAGTLLNHAEAKAQIITGSNEPVGSGSSTNNIDEIQKQLQQLLDQEAKLNMLKQKLLQKLENTQQSQEIARQPGTTPITTQRVGNIAPLNQQTAELLKPNTQKSSLLTDKVQLVKNNAPQFPFTEVNVESGGVFILRKKP